MKKHKHNWKRLGIWYSSFGDRYRCKICTLCQSFRKYPAEEEKQNND